MAMNMDMLVIIVRVPLLVMPWIGCEFLGLRTRNNHICGRTFGSTVRLPQWYQSLNYKEQREGIIGMIGSKRNSSTMTSQPVFHNTQLSLEKLPSSVKKTLSDKIDNLVEITHVPEDVKIPDLQKPLINPYTFYHRQKRSAITNIRHLITRNPSPPVKEIVQSSSLQQCGLQATTSEQYVTIEIPQDLIREYLSQNYTHLHLGAVRLILTLHGRKGLPVTAKIALLDTTFKDYQNALIGALVTTLTNGSHTAHPDDPPVHYYDNGKPVYVSHIQGHFIWDVDPSMCDSDCDCQDWSDSEDEDNYTRRRRKSKKKKKQSCTVSRKPDPPDEPEYKPKFSLKRRSRKSYQDYSTTKPQVVPCIATLGSYDHDFPPLQVSADDTRVTRRPYVTPPQGVSPHGYQAVTPQEEVLNWHTDNALNQNRCQSQTCARHTECPHLSEIVLQGCLQSHHRLVERLHLVRIATF
ncbi:hypothetical protein PIB30_071769 [Stylosanthes scabra]|uniref:Uncharacterized protein n=1 Tax=Stylosanthes scabra TaxID=79078 RepID=A0ABU6XPQ5_9FABA|nr:hypothetical protein [Stylosanthes scabra]